MVVHPDIPLRLPMPINLQHMGHPPIDPHHINQQRNNLQLILPQHNPTTSQPSTISPTTLTPSTSIPAVVQTHDPTTHLPTTYLPTRICQRHMDHHIDWCTKTYPSATYFSRTGAYDAVYSGPVYIYHRQVNTNIGSVQWVEHTKFVPPFNKAGEGYSINNNDEQSGISVAIHNNVA